MNKRINKQIEFPSNSFIVKDHENFKKAVEENIKQKKESKQYDFNLRKEVETCEVCRVFVGAVFSIKLGNNLPLPSSPFTEIIFEYCPKCGQKLENILK